MRGAGIASCSRATAIAGIVSADWTTCSFARKWRRRRGRLRRRSAERGRGDALQDRIQPVQRTRAAVGVRSGLPTGRSYNVDGGLVILLIVGLVLVTLFGYVVLRMAGTQDRRARHAERELDPFSDVTVTR